MIILVFITNPVAADTSTAIEDIVWHGFLSQGFTYTDDNNYLGSSSNGSFKSNELGLNASIRPFDQLNLSAQLLYKQMGTAKPKGLNVDFAIIDWRLIDDFDYGFGLRLGRLKNPFGFFNETRDIAATRPSLLLPESIYLDYLRAVLHSSDSVGAYGHLELRQGTLSYSTIYGKPIVNDETVDLIVGGALGSKSVAGELESETAQASRLSYEDGSGFWRSAITYNVFEADFNADASDALLGIFSGKFKTEQFIFSLQFDWDKWQLIGEYQIRNTDSLGINGGFNPNLGLIEIYDVEYDGLAYYYQMGYDFSPKVTGYIRKDVVYHDKDDKDGLLLNAVSQGRVAAHSAFAKDITLGFIFEPSFNWSFGLELHRINGTHWLPTQENPISAEHKQHWNMYLLQASYRF